MTEMEQEENNNDYSIHYDNKYFVVPTFKRIYQQTVNIKTRFDDDNFKGTNERK